MQGISAHFLLLLLILEAHEDVTFFLILGFETLLLKSGTKEGSSAVIVNLLYMRRVLGH